MRNYNKKLDMLEEETMIKMILFDLDGTLLPMDQDTFIKAYFKHLASMLVQHGYEQEKLITAVWEGTSAMVKNDGIKTNEEVFWKKFSDIFGDKVLNDKPLFDDIIEQNFRKYLKYVDLYQKPKKLF